MLLFVTPDLIKLLPWKLEPVDIPVQSLSSGGFVVEPIGTLPKGASVKLSWLSTIL